MLEQVPPSVAMNEGQLALEYLRTLLNYAILPFALFVFREFRLMATAMHRLVVRMAVVETTVGIKHKKAHHEEEDE